MGAIKIKKSKEAGPDNAIGEKLFLEGDSAYDAGDYKLAFKKMSKAAALGHTGAMLNLGVYYDAGHGVRRSRAKAMH